MSGEASVSGKGGGRGNSRRGRGNRGGGRGNRGGWRGNRGGGREDRGEREREIELEGEDSKTGQGHRYMPYVINYYYHN